MHHPPDITQQLHTELAALVKDHEDKLRSFFDKVRVGQIVDHEHAGTTSLEQVKADTIEPPYPTIAQQSVPEVHFEEVPMQPHRSSQCEVPQTAVLSVPRTVAGLLEERHKRDERRSLQAGSRSDESESGHDHVHWTPSALGEGSRTLHSVHEETALVVNEEFDHGKQSVELHHNGRVMVTKPEVHISLSENSVHSHSPSVSVPSQRSVTNMKSSGFFGQVQSVVSMASKASDKKPRRFRNKTLANEDAKRLQEALKKSKRAVEQMIQEDNDPLYNWTFRDRLATFVYHEWFEYAVFFVIASNVVVVGIEVDRLANDPNSATGLTFRIVDFIYTGIFFMELLLRVFVEGSMFFCSPNWAWNTFDFFVVVASLVDVVAEIIKITMTHSFDIDYLRVFRVIRVTRLIRSFRMVRLVRFVRALRTLVYSILVTLKSLVWALLLLVMIYYGFGVLFTQAVADQCATTNFTARGCDAPNLVRYWGGVGRSMFTLFKAMSGGVSWGEVVDPLGGVDPPWMYVTLFILFICFAYFAVLNVITGVFCQSAMDSAQTDKEIATMQQMAHKDLFIDALKELFAEIARSSTCQEDTAYISLRNLERGLKDDRLQAYLAALDIGSTDAWTLFKLLDTTKSGRINYDEFIEGCMQLKGNAKAVHIAKLSHDNKMLSDLLEDFMCAVDDQLGLVSAALRSQGIQVPTAEVGAAVSVLSSRARGRRSMAV